MVAGLAHSIVGVVEFDDVAAPGTVSYTNGRSRHVVNQIMRSRDSFCPGYVYPRNLFVIKAAIVDEVIARLACEWKRALRAVRLFQVAHETDGAITGFCEFAFGYGELAVIVVDENRIASD